MPRIFLLEDEPLIAIDVELAGGNCKFPFPGGGGDIAMPFTKHHIDPAHIEAMRSAFHMVCDALLLKGNVDDQMTEIIVTKIVALAKAGEHDAERLAELVLNNLADDGSRPR